MTVEAAWQLEAPVLIVSTAPDFRPRQRVRSQRTTSWSSSPRGAKSATSLRCATIPTSLRSSIGSLRRTGGRSIHLLGHCAAGFVDGGIGRNDSLRGDEDGGRQSLGCNGCDVEVGELGIRFTLSKLAYISVMKECYVQEIVLITEGQRLIGAFDDASPL